MRNKFKRKLIIIPLITLTGLFVLLWFHKQRTKAINESVCPTDSIITVREGGRLGNCVWEYIAVLGLQDALKLTPFVPRSILKRLGKVFKNLTIPSYEDTLLSERCRITHGGDVNTCDLKKLPRNSTDWDRLCNKLKHGDSIAYEVALEPIPALVELKASGKLPSILVLPKWIAQAHAFAQIGINRFKQEMQFRDDVQKLAEETLNGVRKKVGSSDLIFVGVHVRRTDYFQYLKYRFGEQVAFADLDFYKRAMSRMLDLYNQSKMVFVVVSDDYPWCKENLVNEPEGVYWGGLTHSNFINNWEWKNNITMFHDLALLALQNHSIIGYGTFALTGSLLSGGHIIAFDITRNGNVTNNLTTRLCKLLSNCELL